MNVNEALQCEDAPLASEMKCKGLMGYLQSYEAKRKLYQFALSLSRYVIECPNCAVIYRSRQYWYGNQDPVETVVRTEIQHVWPGVRTKKKKKKKDTGSDELVKYHFVALHKRKCASLSAHL